MFTGCSSILNNLPSVYTIEIQQGNIISQEMIDQLRPKMTKRQVLYIMGSSMLIDVFHQKRWDYLYSEQPGGEPRKQKRLSLFFDGDELIGVQGDFRPSTLPTMRTSNETTVDVPPRQFEKTLWEKITDFFGGGEDGPSQIRETEEPQHPTNEPESELELEDEPETDDNNNIISTIPLEEEKQEEIYEMENDDPS